MTTDTQLVDYVEQQGIQVWPTRKIKHGPVLNWTAQRVSPFLQLTRATWRAAVSDLKDASEK